MLYIYVRVKKESFVKSEHTKKNNCGPKNAQIIRPVSPVSCTLPTPPPPPATLGAGASEGQTRYRKDPRGLGHTPNGPPLGE
jgi:hypothetical protein